MFHAKTSPFARVCLGTYNWKFKRFLCAYSRQTDTQQNTHEHGIMHVKYLHFLLYNRLNSTQVNFHLSYGAVQRMTRAKRKSFMVIMKKKHIGVKKMRKLCKFLSTQEYFFALPVRETFLFATLLSVYLLCWVFFNS